MKYPENKGHDGILFVASRKIPVCGSFTDTDAVQIKMLLLFGRLKFFKISETKKFILIYNTANNCWPLYQTKL